EPQEHPHLPGDRRHRGRCHGGRRLRSGRGAGRRRGAAPDRCGLGRDDGRSRL
ncbi:MAG: hypothetical protein AVDCRST_MAG07-2446, partial [uncultured Frankineae bacterium]